MKIKTDKEKEYEDFVERNSNDGYSNAVLRYMIAWAEMMEGKITDKDPNEIIPLIADKTSYEADTEGITGFMYGCAVSALAEYWKYGEILRKWHNKEWGYDGEGVVNPAILTIS